MKYKYKLDSNGKKLSHYHRRLNEPKGLSKRRRGHNQDSRESNENVTLFNQVSWTKSVPDEYESVAVWYVAIH